MKLIGLSLGGSPAQAYVGQPGGGTVGRVSQPRSVLLLRPKLGTPPPIGRAFCAFLAPMVAELYLPAVGQAFSDTLKPDYVHPYDALVAAAAAAGILPSAVQQKFISPVGVTAAQGVLPSFT